MNIVYVNLLSRKTFKQFRRKRRRIVVYIATSADGYIARKDGGIDWLNRPRPAGNLGMAAFFRSINTILWGRRTYDESLPWGGPDPFGLNVKNYSAHVRAR